MKIIYIRTSTEDQQPKNQIMSIEKTYGLSKENYTLLEDKESAWNEYKNRESFENLRLLIKKSKGGDLYVWDWDRIWRNRKRLREFFEFCKIYKFKIHSFRQQFYEAFHEIPSPFDEIMQELFLNLLGWMAEDESNKKSDRVKAAMRKKNGKTISYKGKKWGRKSLPKTARNKILELHQKGLTLRKIAKEVTYSDKNKNKKNVSLSAVHKIIEENTTKRE